MSEFSISYVVAAHNQLPKLRPVLEQLLAARQPTEEIVVVDGGSTDGTADYLRGLQQAGQIQQLLTTKFRNEAHGLNIGLMAARGEFLKPISGTTALSFASVRQARDFMLEQPEVDVVAGNAGAWQPAGGAPIVLDATAENRFKRWSEHKEVVWLSALPLLIRRKALALTGFLHTGVGEAGRDFTYRLTSLNVSLAWCSALLAVDVATAAAPAITGAQVLEADRMRYFHDHSQADKTLSRWWQRTRSLTDDVRSGDQRLLPPAQAAAPDNLAACLAAAQETMAQYNATHKVEFSFRAQQITKAFQKPA